MIEVSPQEVRPLWDKIRPGLLKVAEKARDGWIPEDVYMSLLLGKATLFTSEDKDDFGFAVLLSEQDYKGLKVKIWAAYHEGQNGIEKYMDDFKAIAKNIGARCITFDTTRKGYERKFTPGMTTYEVNI